MTRVPGVGAVAPLVALAIVLPLWVVTSGAISLARQSNDLAPVEVGAGPIREQSLGFIGRNVYSSESVELFGYLTAVIGLERNLLFRDTNAADGASLETARFTYSGSIANATRSERADITTTTGDGVLRIYLHENDAAGASWDDPGSFAGGEPVAEFSIHLLDTLQRQAPEVGVLVGDGQLTQETAAEFSLDGERFRFGAVAIAQRLRYVGSPLGGASPGDLAVGLTGLTTVLAREAIPINVGASAVTPAAATAIAEECPQLQPWLSQTRDALSQTEARGAMSRADGDLGTLDQDVLRQAAAEVASLGQTQRGIAPPEAAVEANRLVVTALSTYARGLQVIANAAAGQDPDLLTQGQSVLADGGQLLQHADETISALASACAEPQAST